MVQVSLRSLPGLSQVMMRYNAAKLKVQMGYIKLIEDVVRNKMKPPRVCRVKGRSRLPPPGVRNKILFGPNCQFLTYTQNAGMPRYAFACGSFDAIASV